MTFWDPFGSVYFSNNINAPFSFLGGECVSVCELL